MIGAENLNLFIAFGAGLVSFLSPCVLPLVPSYISFIGGQGLSELRQEKTAKATLIVKTVFFILGFTVVFVLLGILLSGTAAAFSGANRIINIVAGSVVFIFGLNMLFNFLTFLNYEKRFHMSSRPAGIAGSTLLGMSFAAGWSPCIGPILASILALAAGGSSVSSGALMLSVYSIGLAMPFLLTSLFLARAETVMKRLKPHMLTIQRVSGVLLVIIGLLMILGQYARMTTYLVQSAYRLRSWHNANEELSSIVFILLTALPAVYFALKTMGAMAAYRREKQKTDSNVKTSVNTLLIRATLTIIFAVLSILQATGVLVLSLILARWLSFQGI